MSDGSGWATPWLHGAAQPAPTLLVEAFGRLSAGAPQVADPSVEDLYSVFRSYADLMAWSSTSLPAQRSVLWGMNEAELTPGLDDSRIGSVQVGLEESVEPALALPALLRCFEDALGRFGVLELVAVQVTGTELQPIRSRADNLLSGLNWFNAAPRARVEARLLIDGTQLEGLSESELLARLTYLNTGPFAFGPAYEPDTPAGLPPFPGSSPIAVSVVLPEATMAATGWALATVIAVATYDQPGARSPLTIRAELRCSGRLVRQASLAS